MKTLLKTEEAVLFALSIVGFSRLDYAWWVFPVLLLTPDLGMIGYLSGPRIGAYCYNLFHHKGVAAGVWAAGVLLESPSVALAGCILFAHIAMDRMLGYGLKFPDHFQNTHLGRIGK